MTISGLRDAFQMPSQMRISGRSSSITAAFVSAIIPRIEPSDDEINEALRILGMDEHDVRCAYCGDKNSEWDHLRPLVDGKKPTGFITEIRNLVPSCGKCNQSKGNKYWFEWIMSDAKLSPNKRQIRDIEQKIARLREYEKWGEPKHIQFELLVSKQDLDQHWSNWANVIKLMHEAQKHANKIKQTVENTKPN